VKIDNAPEALGSKVEDLGAEPAVEASPRDRISLPGGRRAGPHLPIGMGLLKLADRARAIGASTIQVFSDNPTAWHRRAEPLPDAAEFRQRLRDADIGPVAIHASYLVNLAGPNEEFFGLSVGLLRHELIHAGELDGVFVNVHTGSHRGAGVEAGIRRLVDGLMLATEDLDYGPESASRHSPNRAARLEEPRRDGAGRALLVLENSSGGGASIGSTIEELAQILEETEVRGLDGRIGFCLDAAHLWGAGYDMADPQAIDATIGRFDELIGLDRLAMVHLNDSHAARGSRHDRHSHLGEGQIGRLGLAHLLCHPALAHVAYYLETPETDRGYDAVNVARLADLAAGRPLTPGP
jgi:deoxyribonuclease IV